MGRRVRDGRQEIRERGKREGEERGGKRERGKRERGKRERGKRERGNWQTDLSGLAVNYSYVSVVVFQPQVHVVTERSDQFEWRSLVVIEWVVSN